MPESYCGLCDHCQLGGPEFQAAVMTIKTSLDRLPAFWQRQCFQAGQEFSPVELRRGLDWLLGRAQCSGCKEGGGLNRCDIRECAQSRQQDHCQACSDYDSCRHLIFV